MNRLADVVIVTGAASGIGRASAIYFAQCGASVVAVDIDGDGLASLQVEESKGIHVFQADLVDEDACSSVAIFASSFGAVRGLFNCAGLELHGSVETTTENDWDRVFGVNLKAMFLLSKHVVPLLRQTGGGAIVNMSSVQALATQEDVAAYAASKGAVLSLTRAMALDHGRDGIRVNAICPGTIATPLVEANARHWNPENPAAVLREWGSKHALGRIRRAYRSRETGSVSFVRGRILHDRRILPCRWRIAGVLLERDPEKWEPVFG